ncbi:MAG: CDP-diacylglycerol--glycerol-3-phosphate 3-phosphatidyltransferase [Oscillospiraceae bacterium]|nr:CDP-diacylglycerol--glycerol-3-phosphate 3-phosphatidyltransferase [Oscillospiraceae bacterium]
MNLANKLTMLRVLMIPVYLVMWILDPAWSSYAALAVFIMASLTDLLDGHIARSRNMITDFGKFMDPLADKVLVMTAMVCFCAMGRFPTWALVIVIFREFAVSGLRLIAVEGGRVIAAGWSGKVKTASTMVGLGIMHLSVPTFVDWACIWVIVITTIYSGIEYFVKNKDCIDWKNL